MTADYSYDPGIVLNDATTLPVAGATGIFTATVGGAAQPIYNLGGSPIANLTTNELGYLARFKADLPLGFVNFGSVWQPVVAYEVFQRAAAGGGPSFVVAANDASTHSQGAADYLCDGTADEVQINAAIAALPANGGRVVLTEGTFNVASSILIENDNVTLTGAGAGQKSGATQSGIGTKILAASGIATAIVKVQRAANDRPVYGVLLRDFTVDGATLGTAVDGVLFRSNRGHIDHVHVHRASGNGLRIQGYTSPSWDTYDTEVAFFQAGDCADTGIFLDDKANDVHIVSCILYNNNYNIRLKGSSAQITSCHTYDATTDNIKFDGGGSRTKITGCKIEGAGQHGINIDSTIGGYSDIQITGNGLNTNGDSADNTYDHIIVQGPSGNGISRTQIVGNSFGHKTSVSANKCRYGVNLTGAVAQSTVVVGNSFGPSPLFLPGSTAQIATAPVNNQSNSAFPAFIQNNANAYDDPALPVIDARRAPYNVYGSGDLTTNIQRALDAVPTGGAIVQLPPGDLKITASLVIQKDGTVLQGHGAGNRYGATQDAYGTRIVADSTVTGVPLIKVQRAAVDRTVYGVKFRDLTVDGRSFGSGVTGIYLETTLAELDNVAVHQCSGNGVNIVGYASWHAKNNRFVACDFSYNGLAGITFGANADFNQFLGCVFSNNTQDGMYLNQPGVQADACDFWGNTRYGLFLDGGGHRSNFTGCKFRLNGQHGVDVDTTTAAISDVAFTGCTFATNGVTTTNTYDNVIHLGPSGNALSRFAYVGNSFLYNSGESANKPRYGLNLSTTGTQFAVVQGNTFGPASHWGTAALNNGSSTGSPSQVRNNINWLTEASGTATVPSGSTSIAVAHGLPFTPSTKDVSVTPTNNLGSAAKFWISTLDATNITIAVNVDPGATTATFAWQIARL
jgi:hypothetical protein